MKNSSPFFDEAVALLKLLISLPSFSKQEDKTAAAIATFFAGHDIICQQMGNNVIVRNKYFDGAKPTLLLNSHHDTVKPARGYTNDPFNPFVSEGKLFGLGSNDAGGCLVSLIATFLHYYHEQLPYNLLLAATAEEEISGTGGIELVLSEIGNIDCAIVGEPTLMHMAVAERGLMVVDAYAKGIAGHAARNEGKNALYFALDDISNIRNLVLDKSSDLLGDSRVTVTVIETDNKQHNVVPSSCHFVIDCRINELYNFTELNQILAKNVNSELVPRSMRLRSTIIPVEHPLVQSGIALGKPYYGSPTTSDKALMPFPALKMGPGDSARSHTANEFIFLQEIEDGIADYIRLIDHFVSNTK